MSVWNQRPETPAILVPATILANADSEPEELTHAVFGCMVHLLSRGRYRPEELPPHAMQFYRAYLYYLEVPNGGHSQYIRNTGVGVEPGEAREIFTSAHAGLVAMGATAQADLLHQMMAWVDANPELADEQTGFEGGRAEELEPLDDKFYDADEADSIVKRAAVWIKGWSDLQPVEDAGFEAACYALADANPKRLNRISEKRFGKFHQAATHPLLVCIGLAAAAAAEPEILLHVISGHEITIDNELDKAWLVETDRGMRYSMADETGVSIFEALDPVFFDTPITPAHIGAVIGRVRNEKIDAFLEATEALPVAAAADLLLRRARPDSDKVFLSAAGAIQSGSWLGRLRGRATEVYPAFYLVVDDEFFLMSQTQDGFVFSTKGGGKIYGRVSFEEAEQHAKDFQG
ncbi:MAG: hypothetical protein JWN71_2810 [Xanthobacteraceae bacterium]|nr:hypothetical protein [Xanthobacteraceae bacterium]